MTDKKLTDGEIVKALECCCGGLTSDWCDKCPMNVTKECDKDLLALEKLALDLINRLQAKAIKEQNKNSKLRNERNRLQAQNKDLAETIHNLTLEKDALFDKAEELKAEIERLKTNLNVELENFATEYDNKIKAEAYKEFAERLKDMSEHFWEEKENFVSEEQIDNLLKELVGDDNA